MSLVLVLTICFILFFSQTCLSKKENKNEMRLLVLESGFESLKISSLFNAPFFFLAVLFVLFDLELLLLLPGVMTVAMSMTSWLVWLLVFSVILITLLLEWAWCGLKWQN